MGTLEHPDSSLARALFTDVQLRVLGLIFGQPDRSFYLSEIIQTLQSGTGGVERQLSRLESCGLVTTRRVGNQKHYQANHSAPIFEEIYGIVQKTVGLRDPLRKALAPLRERISLAFVYGSIAKGTDTARSDVDLMVVGEDLTYPDLFSCLEQAEKMLARTINPTILDKASLARKRAEASSFIEAVLHQPKIFVFGSEADLGDEPEPR